MTSGSGPYDLQSTVAQRWWRDLTDSRHSPRPHSQTKVAYYTAVRDLISRNPDEPLTWRTVVDAVRPRGSGSTFYEVTGRHAKHALISAYEHEENAEALQIALTYRRRGAVEQLVDETKVWSFWPYREAHLSHSEFGEPDIDDYRAALAGWADAHPTLAAALDYAPPACAVEDLVVLHRGTLATLRAQRQLTALLHHVVTSPRLATARGRRASRDQHGGGGESVHPFPATRGAPSLDPVIERTQAVQVNDAAPAPVRTQQAQVA